MTKGIFAQLYLIATSLLGFLESQPQHNNQSSNVRPLDRAKNSQRAITEEYLGRAYDCWLVFIGLAIHSTGLVAYCLAGEDNISMKLGLPILIWRWGVQNTISVCLTRET